MRPDTDPTARVLIVDNEATGATVLRRILLNAGYRDVEQVTEPWDAVRRVRSFEPDVVLLDLHMPDPDGFEILRQLSAMASDSYLPVLVLTADTSIQNRERALGLGAADFLTKPYSMAETLLRVRNLVLVRRQHQELVRRAHRLEAEVEQANAAQMEARLRHRQISALIDDIDRRLSSVYQPIVDLTTGAIVGAEALARFDAVPYRPPGQWFAEAAEVGLGTRLELAAVSSALGSAELLPSGAFLSINLSPAALRSPVLPELLREAGGRCVVLELTSHQPIEDHQPVLEVMDGLRRRGVRFSVDDAGGGFSGLSDILRIKPDLIKLDLLVVRDIDRDPARRSMAAALAHFADEIGARLVAVGIETPHELATLRDLGVELGQGYALGRPQALPLAAVSLPAWSPSPTTEAGRPLLRAVTS